MSILRERTLTRKMDCTFKYHLNSINKPSLTNKKNKKLLLLRVNFIYD